MRYKPITFEGKVAAIREVEKGVKKKAEIAEDFQVPPNTLSTYLKNKENILNSRTNENWKDRKRARGSENLEGDECVLKWFKQARHKKKSFKRTLNSGQG